MVALVENEVDASEIDIEDLLVVDRDQILFGDHSHMILLRTIAQCKCINRDIKVITEEDPSGAGLIVLSRSKLLKNLGKKKMEKILLMLNQVGCIRNDVLGFSGDINTEEKIKREIFRSKYEIESLVA